jgi:hexokinase
VLQFFLPDLRILFSPISNIPSHPRAAYSPAAHSPTAATAEDLAICENPLPFTKTPSISKPLAMSLEAETKSIVAHFEYTDEDVNKGVLEFLRQMGRRRSPNATGP